jgi:hypothetical protein
MSVGRPVRVGNVAHITESPDCNLVRCKPGLDVIGGGTRATPREDECKQLVVVPKARSSVGKSGVGKEHGLFHCSNEQLEGATVGGMAAADHRGAVCDDNDGIIGGLK